MFIFMILKCMGRDIKKSFAENVYNRYSRISKNQGVVLSVSFLAGNLLQYGKSSSKQNHKVMKNYTFLRYFAHCINFKVLYTCVVGS